MVGCAALLEKDGWKVDVKESTRRAIKYRRDSSIVIVIHQGRGWFDPLSPAKGDVFSLAVHLGADGFVEACDRVADVVGLVPAAPAWQRPARPKTLASIVERWGHRFRPRPGSPAWRYLTGERGMPTDIVNQAVASDRLREGPQGSMWAAHSDSAGALTGWEERGPTWRGFATEGAKELFRFGSEEAERICVTEAAIDAMSLAAIEALRPDTLYVSTGGGWSPATDVAIRRLAKRANAWLVAATDNNRQGEVYADRVRAIAADASALYARLRPCAGDWNEDLRA
ncbi:Toprim-like [Bradyrhizobium sp. Ghvi]|nr:Toprim-like [Bradyrhizobium sp. Ghvi]